MAWDEGHTVRRERMLKVWFDQLVDPMQGTSRWLVFHERVMAWHWPFSREEPDGHPPFYALLGLAGWRLTRGVLAPLTAFRFGPIALCAITCGVLYHHLSSRRSALAGLTASALLVLMPRNFAHAHYAHYDMPMTCLWLLAQIAFINALKGGRSAFPYGIALGLAAGTKFTGLLAVIPAVLWVLLVELPAAVQLHARRNGQRRNEPGTMPGGRCLLIGLPVALLTLYAIQPPWWFDPIGGPLSYLKSNTTRDESTLIPSLYLGRVYRFSLPWHNTLVLTAVCVPACVLLLGGLGIIGTIVRRKQDLSALVWLLSWGTLMVVRALPRAPGHDMIRLILPSIASLAALAGLGAAWLQDLLRNTRWTWVTPVAVAITIAESLIGIAQTYPYADSYFSASIGGLKGAERLGFDLTYYWETLSGEFSTWIKTRRRDRPVELAFPTPVISVMFLREWGVFPPDTRFEYVDPVVAPDYLLQRRPGVYLPHDWWLERHAQPSFVVSRQGVDLLRLYSNAQYRAALRATEELRRSVPSRPRTRRPPDGDPLPDRNSPVRPGAAVLTSPA
jgi:hypothetical protein